MITRTDRKPITRVPETTEEHDVLLTRMDELQRLIVERTTRLSQENAADQARISDRNAAAEDELEPLVKEQADLLTLSYGYARVHLAPYGSKGDRSERRPHGYFRLRRSGNPEVIIDSETRLLRELARLRLLKRLTTTRRLVRKHLLADYLSSGKNLRNAWLAYRETYSIELTHGEVRRNTAQLQDELEHPDISAA